MEMHQIRYFLAVAKTLNFTRAADQCNVTQPSLTRAIQKLEEEFGGLLFNRERSLTHLTELGRMVPCLSDLGFEPWIDCRDDGTAMWRKRAAEAGVDLVFRHRVDGPSAAMRLIALNLGRSIVPSHSRGNGVSLTALADCDLSLDVVLAAVAGRRRGRAADALLRAARARSWQA